MIFLYTERISPPKSPISMFVKSAVKDRGLGLYVRRPYRSGYVINSPAPPSLIKHRTSTGIIMSHSSYKKQGNRRDMRKIHVTRQFFEASGPQGHFFEKKTFLDKIYGSMCTKCPVCIVFRLARRRDTNKYIHK